VARELTPELSAIGQELNDPSLQSLALRAESGVHFALGEFSDAHEKQQQALELLCRINNIDPLTQLFDDDSATQSCLRALAKTLVVLGYAEQARAQITKAIEHIEERPETFDIIGGLFVASLIYRILEDIDSVQALSERLLAHGIRFELPMSIWSGTYCRGWVLARQGDLTAGIPLIESATDSFRQVGHTMYQTYRLGTLAHLYIQANRLADAEAALKEARFISDTGYERFWDVELHRVSGELAQARGDGDAAVERHYLQAFELARAQQAKILELRAATSLARLWYKLGEIPKAHAMLGETVHSFTEGFDTFDFITATALLDELSLAQNA
jgi:predicted ATPase